MHAWARQKGFSFSAAVDSHLPDQFPEFDFIRKGHNRKIFNLCSGIFKNYSVLAFDFTAQFGGNPSGFQMSFRRRKRKSAPRIKMYSAVVLEAPFELKPLVIRPEHLFDKLIAVFGFDDIDFESKEFSSKFSVKSPDREWAQAVLHDQAIQFLLRLNPTQTIVFEGNKVCLFRENSMEPLELSRSLEVGSKLLDLLPESVRMSGQTRA